MRWIAQGCCCATTRQSDEMGRGTFIKPLLEVSARPSVLHRSVLLLLADHSTMVSSNQQAPLPSLAHFPLPTNRSPDRAIARRIRSEVETRTALPTTPPTANIRNSFEKFRETLPRASHRSDTSVRPSLRHVTRTRFCFSPASSTRGTSSVSLRGQTARLP